MSGASRASGRGRTGPLPYILAIMVLFVVSNIVETVTDLGNPWPLIIGSAIALPIAYVMERRERRRAAPATGDDPDDDPHSAEAMAVGPADILKGLPWLVLVPLILASGATGAVRFGHSMSPIGAALVGLLFSAIAFGSILLHALTLASAGITSSAARPARDGEDEAGSTGRSDAR